jgi:hypothetical protein
VLPEEPRDEGAAERLKAEIESEQSKLAALEKESSGVAGTPDPSVGTLRAIHMETVAFLQQRLIFLKHGIPVLPRIPRTPAD